MSTPCTYDRAWFSASRFRKEHSHEAGSYRQHWPHSEYDHSISCFCLSSNGSNRYTDQDNVRRGRGATDGLSRYLYLLRNRSGGPARTRDRNNLVQWCLWWSMRPADNYAQQWHVNP